MSEPMTASEVAECRARAEACPHGPWIDDPTDRAGWIRDDSQTTVLCLCVCPQCSSEHAVEKRIAIRKFIAAARTDVPHMADTIDALRAELDAAVKRAGELEAGLDSYWKDHDETLADQLAAIKARYDQLEGERRAAVAERDAARKRIAELEALHAKCPLPAFDENCKLTAAGEAALLVGKE